MRILHDFDYLPPARDNMGAERVCENIARGQVALGHEVYLKLREGSKICPVEGAHLTDNYENADIIHGHNWQPDKYAAVGKPWVATIHGYELHDDSAKAYRSKNMLAVSQFAARHLNAVQYVWNCVDGSEFGYEPDKDDYFLWISSTDWGEQKGLFTTIDLCKRLNLKLKMAGSGSNQKFIDRVLSSCSDKIKYVGSVNGAEKVKLIQKAKAVILLTRLPDACPVVVSEALMCGTPVIGSKRGSMPEIVPHNLVGFNCDTYSECIRAFMTIDRISSKTCRQFAEKNFDIHVSAKKHVTIYNRIINSNR